MLLPKLGGSWLLPPRDFPHQLRVTLWITTAIHLDTRIRMPDTSGLHPEEMAKVRTSKSQGDVTPAIVSAASTTAMPIIHPSVKRISLRRSTMSPTDPAGRAKIEWE